MRMLVIRARASSGVAAWLLAAVLVWAFLLMPYLVDTRDCMFGEDKAGKTYPCLKTVAQELREDSNIATYATATVAAIIALQLANRNRAEAARRETGSDQ